MHLGVSGARASGTGEEATTGAREAAGEAARAGEAKRRRTAQRDRKERGRERRRRRSILEVLYKRLQFLVLEILNRFKMCKNLFQNMLKLSLPLAFASVPHNALHVHSTSVNIFLSKKKPGS